jgi:hypothetical protein
MVATISKETVAGSAFSTFVKTIAACNSMPTGCLWLRLVAAA